jgi:type II secretory pathway pseudopilin PulG
MTSAITTTRRGNQAGYVLLMVVFMVATLSILALAALPNILTEGRREKEAEMVWRGQQYTRAIGLYYKKFGKYPTKIEDLTRQTNGVRFLRQAYADPMNKDDGSWRFIYVGPNGQLIGSLRAASLLQGAVPAQGIGGLPGMSGGIQPLTGPGAATTPGSGAGTPPSQDGNSAATPNPLAAQPQPLTGAVLGGNIIGVGSKIKKPSIRLYMGADTYEQWEFIWNPTGFASGVGQAPVNPNANPNGVPNGTTPNGGA